MLRRLWGQKVSETVQLYKKYRQIGTELNSKMIESCLDQDAITKSAKLLGILQGNTLLLDQEEEGNALMDFALNDYQVDGKNPTQIYQEKFGAANDEEQAILNARLAAYTSLFKITEVSKADNLVVLQDLLSPEKAFVQLTDIGFSKTTVPGLLMFIRLVPFETFNMTSGIAFVFAEDQEKHLLKEFPKLVKKVKSDVEAIQRFVTFFKLNRKCGIQVHYR